MAKLPTGPEPASYEVKEWHKKMVDAQRTVNEIQKKTWPTEQATKTSAAIGELISTLEKLYGKIELCLTEKK